ncbi:uncharacterized protein H6S33_011168 [Morchella sextelata]|uniref:uncharacterized protein n=1 Tax=Morchella sextelata TaxID=1174677 RepID=UPI001D03EF7A|nr:uncharacterized protein H6S33_011168 [Morchella sextelata]KAH0610741.1 hypothetical protein H6S33_011168 [Morchella sextelata]
MASDSAFVSSSVGARKEEKEENVPLRIEGHLVHHYYNTTSSVGNPVTGQVIRLTGSKDNPRRKCGTSTWNLGRSRLSGKRFSRSTGYLLAGAFDK